MLFHGIPVPNRLRTAVLYSSISLQHFALTVISSAVLALASRPIIIAKDRYRRRLWRARSNNKSVLFVAGAEGGRGRRFNSGAVLCCGYFRDGGKSAVRRIESGGESRPAVLITAGEERSSSNSRTGLYLPVG